MKANENNILRFIGGSDKKFIIPVYQRNYKWEKENCCQFLRDLKNVYIREYNPYFLGSVVFVSKNNGVCEEYTIIDGQQRIITLSLVLAALRNYKYEHPDIDINADKINSSYLVDIFSDNEKKLELSESDDEAYRKIIENKPLIKNSRITLNYEFFYSEISKMKKDEVKKLLKAMSYLQIVCISLEPERGDDPQLIFESLNATGLGLEPADKIRNLMLMDMNEKRQKNFYKKYWQHIEEILEGEDINRFIKYYLAFKTNKIYDEKSIYTEFKYYKNECGMNIENLAEDMIEYAGYFMEIRKPDLKNNIYTDVLKRIRKLDIKNSIPFLIYIFKINNTGLINHTEMKKIFEIIESYIVRREICGLGSGNLNRIFMKLKEKITFDLKEKTMKFSDILICRLLKEEGKNRFPNNYEFKEKFITFDLYNAPGNIKKYIFEQLENYRNREKTAVDKMLTDNTLTIEHIMPKTLNTEWKEEIGEDRWEFVYSKYKDTPGNLTLTAYNSEYSNFSFIKKKTMPQKGYNFSRLALNDYLKICTKWTEEEILKRAEILFEKALSIWERPEMPDEYEENEIWIEWDETLDLKDRKVTEIVVGDTSYEILNFSDAYKKIHKILYETDPTIYNKIPVPWFSAFSYDLKKAYKIGENAYIELGIDNRKKINIIKEAAELFGLEPYELKFHIKDKDQKFLTV